MLFSRAIYIAKDFFFPTNSLRPAHYPAFNLYVAPYLSHVAAGTSTIRVDTYFDGYVSLNNKYSLTTKRTV